MAGTKAAGALDTTFQLFDAGVALMRQNLHRADPTADAKQIEQRLHAWLAERPGATHGDAVGRPVDPRRFE